jgi:hypothetical protein
MSTSHAKVTKKEVILADSFLRIVHSETRGDLPDSLEFEVRIEFKDKQGRIWRVRKRYEEIPELKNV